jgi:hypothetical protein
MQRRAVAMKQIFCQISSCLVMMFFIAASDGAMAQPRAIPVEDNSGSFCLDGMETVPIGDDLVPTPISVDGGCMVSQTPISI